MLFTVQLCSPCTVSFSIVILSFVFRIMTALLLNSFHPFIHYYSHDYFCHHLSYHFTLMHKVSFLLIVTCSSLFQHSHHSPLSNSSDTHTQAYKVSFQLTSFLAASCSCCPTVVLEKCLSFPVLGHLKEEPRNCTKSEKIDSLISNLCQECIYSN